MFNIRVDNTKTGNSESRRLDYREGGWRIGFRGEDLSIRIDEPDIDTFDLRIVMASNHMLLISA